MPLVVIAFGSNLGDREANILAASRALAVERLSPLYETDPMYVEDQPAFLNAAALLETSEGPLELLAKIKALEFEIGRLPRVRNGPREIDIDLIAYGALQLSSKLLNVPHPRMVERRFVLQPLFDIAPDLLLPGLGVVRDLLGATQGQADHVRKLAREFVG